MGLMAELEKLTEPMPKASAVRRLSVDEVRQLDASGQITHVSKVPNSHICGREVVPTRWGRGTYGY